MIASRAAILADKSASASASRSRSVSLRAGAEDEDEDEDEDDDEAPGLLGRIEEIGAAPPPTATFADGEMSGSFAALAVATAQQQAIRVSRGMRMEIQK
jgi:hypothetical protein